jgi:hypothetical protein
MIVRMARSEHPFTTARGELLGEGRADALRGAGNERPRAVALGE